jgi:TPP-dependent pyruvate/acetoin dehydrogenase alpha subunit
VLHDELESEIKNDALEAMRQGIAEAEAAPDADIGLVFEHAYSNPPAALAKDLAELRRILGDELG